MEKAKDFSKVLEDLSKESQDGSPYKRLEGGDVHLKGEVVLPVELSNQLHQLQIKQKRIEARLDLLFGLLQKIGLSERNGKIKTKEDDPMSRIHWGKTEEEQKLTLYEIFKEAEERGSALRTTELKELGGKFSTAVSYSYRIFGGFKEALRSYRDFRTIDSDGVNVMKKKD